ncbi:MAG: LysM peptidoglycan-binding domain-containing protein, partial [Chloroflexi bacterium]|nr:LysM peptidoglycan-binding domain-containing protein [Chloroflexota bacterium]
MSHKSYVRMTILVALAMLAALIPLQVRAGGVCGGAYTVETGDTVDKLASMCGTSAAAIFAANPGLKEPLTAGQSII